MAKKTVLLILFFLLQIFNSNALKLDRVILSTNDNPLYIEFWPIAAKSWEKIVGVRPTLALIADESVKVDESLGDVIRFKPIPGVSTALYAQCIRLLLPALFENDTCIISDIDMIPLNRNYFINPIKNVADDAYVAYRMYDSSWLSFPMCYNAAKGKVFKEIFNVKGIEDIPNIITKWSYEGHGWATDETTLALTLQVWGKNNPRFKNLKNQGFTGRIDRNLQYSISNLKKGIYIDFHCPRPFSKYKKEIENIVNIVLSNKVLEFSDQLFLEIPKNLIDKEQEENEELKKFTLLDQILRAIYLKE